MENCLKNVKVAITGSSGYVGSATSRLLKENDFSVVGLDVWGKKNSFIFCDLLDYKSVKSTLNGVDIVIHLAAQKSIEESIKNPESYFNNNTGSSENVFRVCSELDIPVLNASSAAVYGEENPYSASKLSAERMLDEFNLNYINLRYFNIGGLISKPGQTQTGNIFDKIRIAVKNNETFQVHSQTSGRYYSHIIDIANHNLAGICDLLDGSDNASYDVASDIFCTPKEILSIYSELGIEVKYEDIQSKKEDPILPGVSLPRLNKSCSYSIKDIVESEIRLGLT